MKILYSIMFVFIIAQSLDAQNAEKRFKPESPAISQFTRYDEMPVSEYTGIPDISIPLYTISEDDLELPLRLSYHAAGIKVDQQASWVGLGWDLSLGNLTQIINDEDDFGTSVETANIERMLPDYHSQMVGSGCFTLFPRRYNYPFEGAGSPGKGWTSTYPTFSPRVEHHFKIATDCYVPINGSFTQRWEKLFVDRGSIRVDSEPDIFKVNLLGETISFIINFKTDKFEVLNKKGYKIVKNATGWIITNPKGEAFHFNQKIETVTNLSASINGPSFHVDNKKSMITWLLNKIYTKNGKEINIEYTITSPVRMPEKKSYTYKATNYGKQINYVGSSFSQTATDGVIPPGLYTSTSFSTEPYYFISKITFPKGTVNFAHTTRLDVTSSKCLNEITILNPSNSVVKKLSFIYDYYNTEGSQKRLKLLSVKENNEVSYKFFYNTKTLPAINSLSQDCWGYYNGHPNASLVPNPSRYHLIEWIWKTNNSNNLSANLEFTKAGILTEIEYPTCGKVSFDYELNTFDNYPLRIPDYGVSSLTTNTGISKGHGLRIKGLTYKDKDGKILKQTAYEYEGGKAVLPKRFFRRMYSTAVLGYEFNPSYPVATRSGYVEEASVTGFTTFNPLSSFDGIGYSKVIKKIIGAQHYERIETSYNNHADITFLSCSPQDAIRSLPAYKDSYYPHNGTVSTVRYYNAENQLVKEINNSYRNIVSPIYYGASISTYDDYYLSATFGGASYFYRYYQGLIGYYPIFDFESLLTQKDETDYFQGLPVVITKKYNYDTTNRIASIEENNSESSSNNVTFYTYPTSGTTAGYQMIAKNRISDIITQTIKNFRQVTKSFIQNNYTWDNSISKLRFSGTESRRTSSSPVIEKISYEFFDANANPVQARGKDNVPITYIWGYNRQYLIAEIKNATYEEVKQHLSSTVLNNLESAIIPSESDMNHLNSLRTSLNNTLITTFTYIPLVGVNSITDEKGKTTYYEYDSCNRLKEIYIMNNNMKEILEAFEYNYANQ